MKRLISITAHPDDDTLFAGTLLKLKHSGWNLSEAILTGGENGVSIKDGVKNLKKQRKNEALGFAKKVGIKNVYWLGGKDGFLKTSDKIVGELLKTIRTAKPDVVVLLNPNDYHKDHQIAYKIGFEATELASRNSYSEYGKAIDTPLILISDGLNLLPHPDIIVDTSEVYEEKLAALRTCYESQFSDDLIQFTHGVSMTRGARIKTKFGEAFNVGKLSSRPMLTH